MYNPATAGNPPIAPTPPPPPPPEEAEEPPGAPRYPYLVNRLRNRQITMEEATELFAIQRQQVRVLMARTNALTAAAAPPSSLTRRTSKPAASAPPGAPMTIENLDPWGEGLLFLALGAGLLAALLKRSQGPAPPASKPATSPNPGGGRS
ncbi:MAG: hypothetical protein L3K14_06180 [Thermoplasmata archaeon]|nr:hypothetical protein [Thermoplasmata archaeon]